MDYNAPSFATDPDAPYVGKTGATVGSAVPPKAAEYPQRELVNLEKVAGIAPSNGDVTQVGQALGRGIWVGALGASANALVGAIGGGVSPLKPGVLQTLNPWTRLRGIALQANTSRDVTVTVAGIGTAGGSVTYPLYRRDGVKPMIGDVPALVPFEFQPDGAGGFRLVEAAPSEIGAAAAASGQVVPAGAVNPLANAMVYTITPANGGSDTKALSFVAPSDGVVKATAGFFVSNQATPTLNGAGPGMTITVAGSVSGSGYNGNSSTYTILANVSKAVVKGETVTVTLNLTFPNTGSPYPACAALFDYLFVPKA